MSALALILAGGLGTRLLPLTAKNVPKAFLSFDNSGKSLLQKTILRIQKIIPSDRIYISAGIRHEKELSNHILDISYKNVILEPFPRGTLACIGLSCLYIKKKDPSAVMVIMPGEQFIGNDDIFNRLISLAIKLSQNNNSIITLGIRPSFPATRFGYIRLGEKISDENDIEAFKSLGFTEKPNEEKASEFLKSGIYLWNSGIYIVPVTLLLELIHDLTPDIYKILSDIDEQIGSENEKEAIERLYHNIRNISIDYAVMEKSKDMLVIPADMDWNDMGTWTEVAETWETDENHNSCFGEHIQLDSTRCIIYSPDRLVVTIGINDLIIVNTPNGLLVCSKDKADDVKTLVNVLNNR